MAHEVGAAGFFSLYPSCPQPYTRIHITVSKIGLGNRIYASTSIKKFEGARCSAVVRAFAYGPMGRRFDPSWWTH